jgi:sugar transferase EpsL
MKRFIDVIVSTVALFVLAAPLLIIAVMIRYKLGAPVLFKQQRPGLNAKPFEMVKFRTMTDGRDSSGNLLPDCARLTTFGRFLRSTSLDELPELWNVLKGEMSLVGPRPLLMDYLPYYNNDELKRHRVRPGLTGYAQVNGRNTTSWEDRMKLDLYYVEHKSTFLDILIIIKTIKIVTLCSGISHESFATMPSFIDFAKSRSKK